MRVRSKMVASRLGRIPQIWQRKQTRNPQVAQTETYEQKIQRIGRIQAKYEKNFDWFTKSLLFGLNFVGTVDGLHLPTEVFLGSHFVIEDQGKLFQKWQSQAPQVNKRFSTHYVRSLLHTGRHRETLITSLDSNGKPVVLGVVLFGLNDKGNTFFQMERRGFGRSLRESVEHVSDFADHLLHDWQQVGPFGTSDRSEKKGHSLVLASFPEGSPTDGLLAR